MNSKAPLIGIVIVASFGLAVLVTLGLAVADLRGDPVVRDLWTWAGRFWTGLCGLLPLVAGVMLAGGVLIALRYAAEWAQAHSRMAYPRHGMQPVLIQPVPSGNPVMRMLAGPQLQIEAPHRNEKAEIVRALASGSERTGAVPRASASVARQLLQPRADEALLPAADVVDVTPTVPLDTALAIDAHNPHWLLIGGTGNGKSVASFTILDKLARELRADVLICERDGVNWNQQAAVDTVEGYVSAMQAVEAERQRRVALLRDADVDHISALQHPPRYLVVVIEEAESIYGDLARLDRGLAQEFTLLLRGIASMGRKQGIMLVVCTQTGTGQVFDVPTRKNFGRRFIFRSEPTVGDAWGLPRAAGLATLPSGTAYDLTNAGLVTFPLVPRPTLPLSRLYRANSRDAVLQLPADAEADGLGVEDQTSGTSGTVPGVPPSEGAGEADLSGTAVPYRSVPLGIPDADLIETIWQTWRANRRNLSATQRAIFAYDGGQAYHVAAYAVNQKLGHAVYRSKYTL